MNTVSSIPQCVGLIMDGNRRWAKNNGLPTLEGHRVGYETFRTLINVAYEADIPHLVCYAFSTENWNREEAEVEHLMKLLELALRQFIIDVHEKGQKINLRIIGERNKLPPDLQTEIAATEDRNVSDARLTVWVALSYGGRREIVNAVNQAVATGIPVTESSFQSLLWTREMPDPDLIIRTSGEQRLSNFLLWQSAYSELFFTNTLWPDFGETEFKGILEAYAERHRRCGT